MVVRGRCDWSHHDQHRAETGRQPLGRSARDDADWCPGERMNLMPSGWPLRGRRVMLIPVRMAATLETGNVDPVR